MTLFRFLLILLGVTLAGCASISSSSFKPIDSESKTVFIQPGSMRVLEPIKKAFRENGWEVNEFDQSKTRYRVHLNTKSTQIVCLSEWSELELELLLLDSKMQETVFVVEGKSCDSYQNLVDELNKLLKPSV